MACTQLLSKHGAKWEAGVTHKFLEECRDGIVGENQFDTWLVQDFLFVKEFVRFAAALLAKAPFPHFDVLLGGIGAIRDELAWFQATAKERGLSLDVDPHPTCQRYIQLMANMAKQPYPVQALAFWAIEQAYNEAWAKHSPMKEPYQQYGQRWGSPQFGEYVKALQRHADEAMEGAPQGQREEAEVAFVQICEMEQQFWELAYQSVAFE